MPYLSASEAWRHLRVAFPGDRLPHPPSMYLYHVQSERWVCVAPEIIGPASEARRPSGAHKPQT